MRMAQAEEVAKEKRLKKRVTLQFFSNHLRNFGTLQKEKSIKFQCIRPFKTSQATLDIQLTSLPAAI
ncbi:hypothetical protein CU666_27290 [Pseudomonas syringae pv. actinidifoliorum]|nr:hypothetical protein [Pseudomonas syringae pv. actinidifoliorum]NAT61368.1 hypothetical protein [Pseudomonas syringae pv. actinidifoliorum]